MTRRAPWQEMLSLIDATAPHGFLIYFRADDSPVMTAAGDDAECVSYLMGNHTIAERMFRHTPEVMLSAPLRTLIWEDASGNAWFSVDQPSTQFASFSSPDIKRAATAIGEGSMAVRLVFERLQQNGEEI